MNGPTQRRPTLVKAGKIQRHAIFQDTIVRALRVNGSRRRHFIQVPISLRLAGEHCIRVGIRSGLEFAPWLAGDLFQQFEGSLRDLRFCGDFQAGSASWPGGVAAESVLFGRGDIAFGTIGEFHGERGLERALRFEFETCEGKDFIGNRRDSQFTDAQRLEL